MFAFAGLGGLGCFAFRKRVVASAAAAHVPPVGDGALTFLSTARAIPGIVSAAYFLVLTFALLLALAFVILDSKVIGRRLESRLTSILALASASSLAAAFMV